ncbi:MAG: NUDIX hydrolase [Thermodesulfobacteriota bacterium]
METKVRTLGRLLAKNFFVELDEVRRDTRAGVLRVVIRHPSAVVVVPVLGGGETLVVRQYRYAHERETVELPAGKLDPGETPEEAAVREMIEETGHRPGRLARLLSFAPSIGYSTEIIHVFAAYDLTRLADRRDDGEITGVERITFTRLKDMITRGELVDGTTMLALAAYEWLGQ